jgi:hypothetical protein
LPLKSVARAVAAAPSALHDGTFALQGLADNNDGAWLTAHRDYSSTSNTFFANRPDYGPTSWLPVRPWKPVTSQDLKISFNPSEDWNVGSSVLLSSLPSHLLENLRAVIRILRTVPKEDPRGVGVVTYILEQLHDQLKFSGDIRFHGLFRDNPGEVTVSVDPTAGKYVGLHIDRWDRLPLRDCHAARNRVSVNIGDDSRAFLFTSVRADRIPELVNQFGGVFDDSEPAVSQLFERVPEIPTFRAILPPGACYVAPTDNLVHDGSTEEVRIGSESLVIRSKVYPIKLTPQ